MKKGRPQVEELKEGIKTRLMEKIQRQEQYRDLYLQERQKKAALNSLDQMIEHYSKHRNVHTETMGPPPLFNYGNQYLTIADWRTTFNLELHRYSILVGNLNYMKQALKNDGMSQEQIDDLIFKGKYTKVFSNTPKKRKI